MTPDHDLERRLDDLFAAEAPTGAPDWLLASALAAIDVTPQRRALVRVPWRFQSVSTFPRLAIAAAAVLVVAVAAISISLLPRAGVGGPTPTPSASPPATPFPLPASGPLDPGTYVFAAPPGRVTLTVPAGWASTGLGLGKHPDQPGEVGFGVYPYPVSYVFGDACRSDGNPRNSTNVGPSVQDLVTALVAQSGSKHSAPEDVTLGGHAGKRIVFTMPSPSEVAGCHIPGHQIWVDASGLNYLAFGGPPPAGTLEVDIVEIAGERAVFLTARRADASAADLAELDAVIASISITP